MTQRRISRDSNFLPVALPVGAALILGIIIAVVLSPGLGLGQSGNANTLRIYLSVPFYSHTDIVNGAQLAFDEAGGTAGGHTIEFVPLRDDVKQTAADDSWHWDGDLELANARRAAADPQAIAYIGTYNSGAAKFSIPVLNRVHLAMISPGNTYPGLTKPNTGVAGEPWVYYPLGIRNYFRVLPADDLQGAAGAYYAAKQLGAKSFYTLDDTELYGHGVAVIFDSTARELGMQSRNQGGSGSEGVNGKAGNFSSLASQVASRIMSNPPDLVFYGGDASNHPGQILKALRSQGYQGYFFGADAMISGSFIDEAGHDEDHTFATLVGLPADQLTDWAGKYKQKYGAQGNYDFAPFGYMAMQVALKGIDKAAGEFSKCDSLSADDKRDCIREKVRAAVGQTKSTELTGSPSFGTDWQFDANGDTTLGIISTQRVGTQGWIYDGKMTGAKTEWKVELANR